MDVLLIHSRPVVGLMPVNPHNVSPLAESECRDNPRNGRHNPQPRPRRGWSMLNGKTRGPTRQALGCDGSGPMATTCFVSCV